MARGVDGRVIFADDGDRNIFLTALAELKAETGFSVLAFCLMGNHFHLAIKVRHIPLSTITQRLLTRYAITFNLKHGRTGHLFQARYKAVLCVNERYLLRLVDYIHQNPVRSGLVTTAEKWQWSSARTYAGGPRNNLIDPIELPAVLGLSSDESFDPWQVTSEPALLRIPGAADVPLGSLAESVSREFRVPIDAMRSRRRSPEILRAKRAFISECVKHGLTLSEISRWLNCTPAAAHYLAYRAAF